MCSLCYTLNRLVILNPLCPSLSLFRHAILMDPFISHPTHLDLLWFFVLFSFIHLIMYTSLQLFFNFHCITTFFFSPDKILFLKPFKILFVFSFLLFCIPLFLLLYPVYTIITYDSSINKVSGFSKTRHRSLGRNPCPRVTVYTKSSGTEIPLWLTGLFDTVTIFYLVSSSTEFLLHRVLNFKVLLIDSFRWSFVFFFQTF